MRARRIGIGENYYDSVANPIVGNTDLIVEGDVGIGTVSPIANLHIVGTGAASLKVAGANDVAPWIHLERTEGGSTNDLWSLVVDASEKFLIRRSMSTQFTIDTNGRVGIGTETPTDRLHVIGAIRATGNVIATCGILSCSSREVKKDIQYLKEDEYKDILERLTNTQVVRYRFKESSDNKLRLGVISEEAPEEIVSEDKKNISYPDYLGFLLAAIKAQQEEIKGLKQEISKIKEDL